MRIAIHPDTIYSTSFSEKWAEFLDKRNVEVKWVDLTSVNALGQVNDCDGVMWRWGHAHEDKLKAPRILYVIEHCLGIPVFPNHRTTWHYDDKVAQHYIFCALDIPAPKAWVFWDAETARQWANTTEYPKVFKLTSGASSSNVIKVNSKGEALGLIKLMFGEGVFPANWPKRSKVSRSLRGITLSKATLQSAKECLRYVLKNVYPPLPRAWWMPEKGYIYFQEFIPDNTFDTRITVIGDRAFGFVRHNRSGDFRASGSGLLDYDVTNVRLEAVELAFEVCARLQCQSLAFDILFDHGRPLIGEISYVYVDTAVYDCPGHWKPDLTWVEGHMWPEEAQVDDFIEYIKRLKK